MAKILRKIIEIDEELCDGCGQCVPACEEGAIQIIDGKARLVAEKYCDGLGACLGDCPKGAIKIVEREAEAFDEEAVKEYLAQKQKPQEEKLPCGCPGSHLKILSPVAGAKQKGETPSALSNWPIQIKLVPPHAPFLKDAHLLVAADCVGFSYPAFHQNILPGKILMVGCPKFDDAQEYVEKFAQIFRSQPIKELTLAIMEVPCCHSLMGIINKACELAGKKINYRVIIVSADGKIVEEKEFSS
ncbi:4Fe-4S ferredoxin iron-sulfur binding domain protein [Thermodesulfatator indicus DSM 15286]|uniref:4Fe-4S ferredoxin iron-sulfur binding domain protein n=1 Tax=Thermodesulfatator indicus (strain DSM 15286 / JCM 11887 / CIR29812) TaxID=667014 RepID=F8AD24_THEID|nr:4Fe-4S binding protein [Thermodesulfatator indicus]AEH45894.1 4Fe-4S ferredoxin iron-sulfur binding domain protein [Thermodesulfatator indicus DSM 15286]